MANLFTEKAVTAKGEGGQRRSGARRLGFVGGLAPGAASRFYREVAKDFSTRGETLDLTMVHADLHRVLRHVSRGENVELAEYLLGLFMKLQAAGAEWAAIPAVAPHCCIEQLRRISMLPMTDILDATRRELLARGARRVSVFGTRFVMETEVFGALRGVVEVVVPTAAEVETVNGLYRSLVERGSGTEGDRDLLIRLATVVMEREGVDAVLLAGTDFAVLPEGELPFAHVDCFAVYVRAVLRDLRAGR